MGLSVTGRAALQRFHFPVVNELLPVDVLQTRGLIGIGAPLPVELRDFVRRTNLRRRVAMAVEAETHAQRFVMAHFIHLVNATVAFRATDAAINVN